jgi:NAD+ kinase
MESSEMSQLVNQVASRDYTVEPRLTLRAQLTDETGAVAWGSFAVNEMSIEKEQRQMMIDVLVTIDGRPLSRWGCDGVLVATPTGSTAYAFSAGGPVVWPDVAAIELVPLLAHALFARPLVLSPASVIEIEMTPGSTTAAVVWCDGRRDVSMTPGCTVTLTRNPDDLLLARLKEQPFTTRLVRKFELPINGWRKR